VTTPSTFPFAAVVGQPAAKLALLLLSVDPKLQGALVGSGPGTAKTTLARSLQSIWPGDDAPIRPDDEEDGIIRSLVIELPLNATEDRLLGSLDLDRTLASGGRHMSIGLLTLAQGRVLYADDINLLDSGIARHVAAALDSGIVRTEREGISAAAASEFVLIGTYNPEEGDLSTLLRDRVGLLVETDAQLSPDMRAEIADRARRFGDDPMGFLDEYAEETGGIRRAITEARRRLPRVRLPKDSVRKLIRAALDLGVEGNRADIFAMRAARASAALAGRNAVNEDDLRAAIRLVLVPRRTAAKADGALRAEAEDNAKQAGACPANDAPDTNDTRRGEDAVGGALQSIEDLIINAADAAIPKDVLSVPAATRGRAASGRRVTARGSTSGRYTGSSERRPKVARVALDATLRAAAPFQLSRGRSHAAARASAEHRVIVKREDLRFKKFKRRSGMLFIFVVDASGSMALNRMAQAKGAMLRILRDAYLHRDSVALIAFRGEGATVLLPPTRSVLLASHVVDALPVGGGTPLAAGLVQGLELARRSGLRDGARPMLLVFTDGRANIGLGQSCKSQGANQAPAIAQELQRIGAILQMERIPSVVVDTRPDYVSRGEGRALAQMLGGRCIGLPTNAGEIDRAVSLLSRRSP